MIIVRSPLRISFAGGGSDLADYYRQGFGATCSMAINKYVYVTINNLADYFPHRFRIAYSQTELAQDAEAIKHPIVRESLREMNINGGIDINVMSDIPAGTGMGSSSTFTVAILHALHAFKNNLVSKEFLAREASRIEIDVLKEPIGKQDQYAAAFGGINLFKFHKNEQVSVEPLPLSESVEKKILSRLQLFYLGGSRSASHILKDQSSNVLLRQSELNEMRDQALRMAEVLSASSKIADDGSSLDEMGQLLHRGWLLKKSLSREITNTEVDLAMDDALNAGAIGGKLLGAGGTGFLLLYVPPSAQPAVRKALGKYAEVHFQIDHMGSTLLYYGN